MQLALSTVRVLVFYSYICSRLYVHVQVRTCNLPVLSTGTVHVCTGTAVPTQYAEFVPVYTRRLYVLWSLKYSYIPVGDYYYYEYE